MTLFKTFNRYTYSLNGMALSALGLEDLGALLDVARGDSHLRRETTDQLVHTWPPIRKHGSAL